MNKTIHLNQKLLRNGGRNNLHNRLLLLLIAIAGIGILISAKAGNIVSNPSFETPIIPATPDWTDYAAGNNLGGWIVATGSVDLVNASGHEWNPAVGNQALDLSGFTAGQIYQDLATTSGTAYSLSFDLSGNYLDLPTIKHLNVDWGTQHVASLTFDTTGKSFNNPGWQSEAFTVIAIGSVTRLTFTSLDSSSAGPMIDAVSVTVLDAPVLLSPAMLTNGQFVITWIAAQGINYQLQYKTNLNQTNWINIGTTVTASNTVLSVTNAIGSDNQRFYRVEQQ